MFTATFSNLSTDTGSTQSGSYAVVSVNGIRFDLDMHSDGLGNQILSLDPFTGSPNSTIAGLGTNPVTLSLIYNNATDTGDAYVNGVDVISGFAGHNNFAGEFVAFGGENGDFYNVELLTGAPPPVPEPASIALLSVGCVALALLRRRRTGGRVEDRPGSE
jgi:hypothetical protein